jgi:fumarylacetoacetate (FAA) hydrolase
VKLATRDDGSRDGRLMVVSDDLARWVAAPVPTMQAALDDWAAAEPALRAVSTRDGAPFEATECLAPLPRAYQWLDASAYLNHVELVRKARGAPMPPRLFAEPLIYQGGSDGFLSATAPIPSAPGWGADFEAEIAVILSDVPMGADRATAARAIRLVTLVNDVSLRGLIPDELSKGFGFLQGKPATAFAPVVATPDAVPAWDGARLDATVCVDFNDQPFGRTQAGRDMAFDFPALIVHAARTRSLAAGTVLGSGTVSNREEGGPGRPLAQGGRGYSCISEQRMVEGIAGGQPRTPFLAPGDRVAIWAEDAAGHSFFGRIDQTVVAWSGEA